VLPRQASVLMAIHNLGEKATPTEISRLIIRDSQTISEILNRMEKDKLINRIKDTTNNKRKIISLTEKGRQAYYLSLNRESIHSIMSCLSIEEQKQFTSCLAKLAEASLKVNQVLDGSHPKDLEEQEL
jgi:DNA-binding MarR family transcriptional regulator